MSDWEDNNNLRYLRSSVKEEKKVRKPKTSFIPHVKESDYLTIDELEVEKRCNAYPKMVKLLRRFYGKGFTSAGDLLKELGELDHDV